MQLSGEVNVVIRKRSGGTAGLMVRVSCRTTQQTRHLPSRIQPGAQPRQRWAGAEDARAFGSTISLVLREEGPCTAALGGPAGTPHRGAFAATWWTAQEGDGAWQAQGAVPRRGGAVSGMCRAA